jgi:tetratricopeptide (TPR) repeat protein
MPHKKPTSTQPPPAPPALTDFWVGIETLRVHDIRETRARHSVFCQDRLQMLDEKRAKASVADLPAINAESAIVRVFLAGKCLFPDGEELEAIKQGETALREALSSGCYPVIYDCLGSLGSWYMFIGNEEQAVVCFQRAIAYSYDPSESTEDRCAEVLMWLGSVWSRKDQTLNFACMTAEWRKSLQPFDIEPWRDEFLWLIRQRRHGDVEAIVAQGLGETCADAARHTAALLALGRYHDAIAAAKEGRSRALASGEQDWSRTFDRILSPEGPALQGR